MSRRHYRVAQKEVENEEFDGIYIHTDCVVKVACAISCLAILLFLKGVVIGYIACKKCNKCE